jgi:hypothetical protein
MRPGLVKLCTGTTRRSATSSQPTRLAQCARRGHVLQHITPFHAERPRSGCRRHSEALLLPDKPGHAGPVPASRRERAARRNEGGVDGAQNWGAAYAKPVSATRTAAPHRPSAAGARNERDVAVALVRAGRLRAIAFAEKRLSGRRARDDSSWGTARRGVQVVGRCFAHRRRARALAGGAEGRVLQTRSRQGKAAALPRRATWEGSCRRAVSRSAGRMQRSPRVPQQRCSSSHSAASSTPIRPRAPTRSLQRSCKHIASRRRHPNWVLLRWRRGSSASP